MATTRRVRTAKAVAEESENNTPTVPSRGPTKLQEAMAKWLTEEVGVRITAKQVHAAQTMRKAFRATELYQDTLEAIEQEKEEAAEAKATRRAAEKEPAEAKPKRVRRAKAAEPEEETPEPEAAPAKPTRTRRSKAASTSGEPGTDGPVETPRTRRRRRGEEAPAETDTATEDAPAAEPKTTRRKSPF